MPGTSCVFVDKVPDYEIRDGNMHITADDWHIAMPLRLFRMGMARATRIIAEHESRKAEVLPLKSRRGHAASS